MSELHSHKLSRLLDVIIEGGLISILIFTPLARGAVRLWSITPVQVATLIILCAWFLKLNAFSSFQFNNLTPIRRTPLDFPIFLFVILAIISTVFSIYRHDSILELYRLLTFVAIYYIVVNNINTKEKMTRLIAIIISIGAFISLFGLIQYLGGLPHGYWQPEKFLASTYVNHNHFAGYLEMTIPLTIGLLFTNLNKEKKILLGFLTMVMILAFILSMSRGAWTCLTISLLIMGISLSKKGLLGARIWILILCGIVIFFALTQFGLEPIIGRARTIAEGVGIDEIRLKIWQGTGNLIKAHPFIGSGIGTFVHAFPKYKPIMAPNIRPVYAHNDYLHIIAELGVFALPLILWMILITLRRGFRIYSVTRSSFKRAVTLGASIGVISILLHSLVDFNLHIPANAILFTTLVGIIMASNSSKERNEQANFD